MTNTIKFADPQIAADRKAAATAKFLSITGSPVTPEKGDWFISQGRKVRFLALGETIDGYRDKRYILIATSNRIHGAVLGGTLRGTKAPRWWLREQAEFARKIGERAPLPPSEEQDW